MQHRDPVCGMMVDSDRAAAESTHGSAHYYFCSTTCRDRFEDNPAQYLGNTRSTSEGPLERHEPPNTTIDGFTAPKFGSAGSGGAEYERVPEQHKRD
jgi:YHS domain-containing protein